MDDCTCGTCQSLTVNGVDCLVAVSRDPEDLWIEVHTGPDASESQLWAAWRDARRMEADNV